ncbi:dTDP-4-dehydrorhamnose 3,5-epimerase [Metabacillus fastidiosus]|uniref:dTDP-4-dehydrorhamnose 3,5-epimerase n=1 Tax=Metabacillus fastidiosus TaxID=1458 RepID=UPI003D2AAF5E
MNVIHTDLAGVVILEPTIHRDNRGFFTESFNEKVLRNKGIHVSFVQDNHSMSREAGTIRGLHFQLNPKAQTKLVRVLKGAIYDVIVDLRRGSKTYRQWSSFILSEHNQRQLYVPKGFAHGFCTLVPDSEIFYKVDEYYSPDHDRGISWNDPSLSIPWPTSNPILSNKDKQHPNLDKVEFNF